MKHSKSIEQHKWVLLLNALLSVIALATPLICAQQKKAFIAYSMKAQHAQVKQTDEKRVDWRTHAPKRGHVTENTEVASISNSQLKILLANEFSDEGNKIITYQITSQTKIYDAEDRRLTWKAIKKGDRVTVVTKVNGKVALIILKVS